VATLRHETHDQASAGLRPCAFFELPEAYYPDPPAGKHPLFRDPAGVLILRKIAERLSNRGYRTTEVRPAIAIEAGFRCRVMDGFEIQIILGISRQKREFITCELVTYYSPSLLDRWRGRSAPAERVAEWSRLCDTISEEIVATLYATSVLWLTEAEASERWKKGE
jgi:hypothetical protein